jgi:hypothetical protein
MAVVGALALALFAGTALTVTLIGGPNDDVLEGTPDPDTLDGRGDDSISLIADGDPDIVKCGGGFDSFRYFNADESGLDTLSDCEDVTQAT